MRVTFCSILLNESFLLEANLRQHYAFCDRWILIEGADRLWPESGRTAAGLSIDNSAEIIRNFPDPDHKLIFKQVGLQPDKMALRNYYAELLEDEVVIVIDIDEFLTHSSVTQLVAGLQQLRAPGCIRIPFIHFINSPHEFITGGYWDVSHHRAYRWQAGSRYSDNHNHPRNPNGRNLHDVQRFVYDRELQETLDGFTHPEPVWLTYANLKPKNEIVVKNQYYVERGEATTRPRTTADRAAVVHGDYQNDIKIRPWVGPWPEALSNGALPV